MYWRSNVSRDGEATAFTLAVCDSFIFDVAPRNGIVGRLTAVDRTAGKAAIVATAMAKKQTFAVVALEPLRADLNFERNIRAQGCAAAT